MFLKNLNILCSTFFLIKKVKFIVLWGRRPYVEHSPIRGGPTPDTYRM